MPTPSLRPTLVAALLLPLLVGCSGLAHFSDTSTATSLLPAITGTVHGGQQPVSGTKVQLYASNTTTLKGASTALIASSVLTDANGSFSITGKYTCPAPGSLVYLVVTGGNPGLAAGTANTAISMLAVLGTCGTLTASTHVVINELTTVAGVEALKPFMADGTHIGADLSTNPTALAVAFASAASIVDPSTGQFAALAIGQPTPPYALYNTLADILAACINTNGSSTTNGSLDDTKPCGALFFRANNPLPSTDTLVAMLNIAQFPSNNVTLLFLLVSGTGAPFQPTLAAPPAHDFTYGYTVSVPPPAGQGVNFNYARMVAIDGLQHIWVANYASRGIHVYDQNLNLLYDITSDNSAYFLKADPAGNIWSYGSNLMTKFAPDGTKITPVGGINIFAMGFFGQNSGMDVDKSGNVWIATKKSDLGGGSSNQGAPCFAKFSPSGIALFPAPGICFDSTTIGPPLGITTDSAGNAYMGTNYPITILKVDANGNSLYGPAGKVTYRGVTLQYDPTLDRVWVTDDGLTVSIKASDGSYVGFNRQAGGATNTSYVTLDGANNLWLTSTTDLGTSLQCSSISAYTPAGVAITTGQTDNSCSLGGLKTDNLVYPQGIAIDAYGDLWVVNYATHLLQKIPAQAVPKVKQTL